MAWMHLAWLAVLATCVASLLWLCWRRQQPLHNKAVLALLQQSGNPACLTDQQGLVLWMNLAAAQLWSPGRILLVRLDPEQHHNDCQQILQQLRTLPSWQGQIWLNNHYQVPLKVSRLHGSGPVVWLWQCNELPHHATAQAASPALLLSTEHWQHHLQLQLAQHLLKNHHLSLLLLQIDELPQVRRHFGQGCAQTLRQQILQQLQPALPLGAVITQTDESRLAILFSSQSQYGQAMLQTQRVALDLLAACHGPFALAQADCTLACNIGIAIAPPAGSTADSLQRNAGLALLQASNQRSRLHFWQQAEQQAPSPLPAFDLEQVLGQYQCQLWGQPVVQLDSAQPESYHTELRWAAPEFGVLSYAELQPLALQHGHLLALERWGFSQLCQQMELWQQQNHTITLQYTFGPDNILHLGLVAFISEQLADHGLSSSQLVIRCDEQAYLRDADLFLQQANRLQQLGFRLLLCGVGDGLSALRILRLPCWSGAELSAALCAGLEQSDQQRNVCASLVRLLVNCGLTVQCCALEQELQAYLLQVMGVQSGRGNCFAAMQPLNRLFSDWAEQRQSA